MRTETEMEWLQRFTHMLAPFPYTIRELHLSSCKIEQKVRETGIVITLKDKTNHHLCQNCSIQADCTVTTATMFPFHDQVLYLVPTSGEGDELERQMESMARLLSSSADTYMEKKRLERENLSVKNEIRSLFEFLDQPYLAVDQHHVVQEVSSPLCALLNRRRSDLMGEWIGEVFPDLDLNKWDSQRKGQFKMISGKWELRCRPVGSPEGSSAVLIHVTEAQPKEADEPPPSALYTFADIKGVSSSLESVKEIAERIAPTDATVLIRGESGTGKEVFAQSIHGRSKRSQGKFVAINCAAIPESLLESELFGYESGAFTGAKNQGKPGRFEMAHGGTIFLDEIGDMSLYLQAKLLRVLQERRIERVGGTESMEVDVRVIAATHQPLELLVSKQKFREDLYYRLNVIPIHIPPLRERKEDIPILIEAFMKTISKKWRREPKSLSPEALDRLLDYPWPGNIRELKNVVEHFVQLEVGDWITMQSLPSYLLKKSPVLAPSHATRKQPVGEIQEKEQILHLLDEYGRDTEGKQKVALALGMSVPTLYRRLRKWKIK